MNSILFPLLNLVISILKFLDQKTLNSIFYEKIYPYFLGWSTSDDFGIIITKFHIATNVPDPEIEQILSQTLEEGNIENIKIHNIPIIIHPERDNEKAKKLAERYNAKILICGSKTGAHVITVHFFDFIRDTNSKLLKERNICQPESLQHYVLEILPKNITLLSLYSISRVCEFREDYLKAIQYGNQASELAETIENVTNLHAKIVSNLAIYYAIGQRDFESGIPLFDKAIQLSPDNVAYYQNRGLNYRQLGKLDLAQTDFEKSLQMSPDNLNVIVNLCGFYLQINLLDKLEELLKVGLLKAEINPEKHSSLLNLRALMWLQRSNSYEALTDLDSAISINPYEPSLYFNRGSARLDTILKIYINPEQKPLTNDEILESDYQNIISDFQNALNYGYERQGLIYYLLSQVYMLLSEREEVVLSYLKKALPFFEEDSFERNWILDAQDKVSKGGGVSIPVSHNFKIVWQERISWS